MEDKYITSKELAEQLKISREKALEIINEAERIMKKKNLFLPISKPKMVLKHIVYELLGIKGG